MIIIGITGTLGAGKGTVVEYLVKQKGFIHFSVRGYLTEIIYQKGEPLNRDTLTRTANELRSKNNPAFIVQELYRKAASLNKNCIIESIRTPGEIISLRTQPNFYLMAVDGDIRIRYERIRSRGSETDNVDFETFQQNELREMHTNDPNKQNLAECIKQADFVISNNGSLEQLHHSIESFISNLKKV